MKRCVLMVATAVLMHTLCCAEVYRPRERWRGFNLMGMFVKGSGMSPGHFPEEDFRQIRDLGFNFVRLPLDYRFWIAEGDWERIDEQCLAPVDQAVALARKYGIHVMLNFHRAPGYTVAKPPEALNVFKDAEALRVCVLHWGMVARRYKDVPAGALSFNLFNEPMATPEEYERVVVALLAEIRCHNPERLVICDGLEWGKTVVPELFKHGIGQASRGYAPGSISHYRASWAGNPTAPPCWPPSGAVSPLYGPVKQEHAKPLVIDGVPACRMIVKPGRVSGNVTFEVKAGDRVLATFPLEPKKGAGWSNAEYKEDWKIFQADCDTPLEVDVPPDCGTLSLAITAGDWAGIETITLRAPDGRTAVLPFAPSWYAANPLIRFKDFDAHSPFQAEGAGSGRQWLERNMTDPWVLAAREGHFVMVGEFGAYKHTPHAIVLEWMEDYLKIWKEAGMGWALWNFSGTFGVIDSGREDVAYEEFHGRRLDRKMLELLQRY